MSKENLVECLELFLEKTKNDTLDPRESQLVGELYINWKYQNASRGTEFTEADIMKFVSCGWYVHDTVNKLKELNEEKS